MALLAERNTEVRGARWQTETEPSRRKLATDVAAENTPLVSAAFVARVPAGQTLISGGWIHEPGKRIFMLSAPASTPNAANEGSIDIPTQLIEVSEAIWKQLGWEQLRSDPQQEMQGLLDASQTAQLLKTLNEIGEVTVRSSPRITTANGQERKLSSVRFLTICALASSSRHKRLTKALSTFRSVCTCLARQQILPLTRIEKTVKSKLHTSLKPQLDLTLITMSWLNAKSAAAILAAALIAGTATYFVQERKLARAETRRRELAEQQAQLTAARDAALAVARAMNKETDKFATGCCGFGPLEKRSHAAAPGNRHRGTTAPLPQSRHRPPPTRLRQHPASLLFRSATGLCRLRHARSSRTIAYMGECIRALRHDDQLSAS